MILISKIALKESKRGDVSHGVELVQKKNGSGPFAIHLSGQLCRLRHPAKRVLPHPRRI